MAKQVWRLIKDEPASGAWNMAVDEAILLHAGRGESLPTLRLYAWTPACLSLGYAQHYADVDHQRLKNFGWDVVRRPTGGKAILHTDELTYSVTGPRDNEILFGGVLESYNRLAKALMAGVTQLGLPVKMQDQLPAGSQLVETGPVCFEVPSAYEITSHNKKLIGSAQARRREGVLQHGSLPLYGDLTRITQALVFESEAVRADVAKRLLAHATTVEMVSGQVITWETAAKAFVSSFEQILEINFEIGELSASELMKAQELLEQKYLHESWNERV